MSEQIDYGANGTVGGGGGGGGAEREREISIHKYMYSTVLLTLIYPGLEVNLWS